MTRSAKIETVHPMARAQSFDELAEWVGAEPSGALAGPPADVAALRTARWLMGTVSGSDGLTDERTRDVAERLRRLADLFS